MSILQSDVTGFRSAAESCCIVATGGSADLHMRATVRDGAFSLVLFATNLLQLQTDKLPIVLLRKPAAEIDPVIPRWWKYSGTNRFVSSWEYYASTPPVMSWFLGVHEYLIVSNVPMPGIAITGTGCA